jgi:ubiquinone/menaquinone biosynthesis C-methylase UbiE
MLLREAAQTHEEFAARTFEIVADAERPISAATVTPHDGVDEFVQHIIGGTNSNLYAHLKDKLKRYPIPELRLPRSVTPGTFIDVGCNWGRWCIAAARAGFQPVGVDPSLEAILAATRVARQLGLQARYVVADARFLPFRSESFQFAHSYSVFQHFDKRDAKDAVAQIGRVLSGHGVSVVQMLNKFGLRSAYVQARRGFRRAVAFETRYWTPAELKVAFSERIGPSELLLGSFFTQGQASDKDLFRPHQRAIFEIAEVLKRCAAYMPWLINAADNLYVYSTKPAR